MAAAPRASLRAKIEAPLVAAFRFITLPPESMLMPVIVWVVPPVAGVKWSVPPRSVTVVPEEMRFTLPAVLSIASVPLVSSKMLRKVSSR